MVLDDGRKNFAQVFFAGVIRVFAKSFDAFGEALVGEDERHALEVAINAALRHADADGSNEFGHSQVVAFDAGDVLNGVLAFFVETLVKSGNRGIGKIAESTIEHGQGGETIFNLIHERRG